MATLRRALPGERLAPDSPGMLHHQRAEDGNGKLNRGVERHFTLPEGDFDRWHYLTQVVQARAVATGIEHWRSHWPLCAGTVVWQINDCWPVSSWAAEPPSRGGPPSHCAGCGRTAPRWRGWCSTWRSASPRPPVSGSSRRPGSWACRTADRGLSLIWTDDAAAVAEAVRYLAALGHRRVAHVGGPRGLGHSAIRTTAFERTMERTMGELGLGSGPHAETSFSGEEGARATRSLLLARERPTAILYDNDIMAVAGLGVAAEMGISVPDDLSLLAWDDSQLCRLTHPTLSAMHFAVWFTGRRSVTTRADRRAVTGSAVQLSRRSSRPRANGERAIPFPT
ncbi:hypothetical protein GCM10010279_37440 [Streptomyces mutabilis]|nr:substrate-binding domain-containing protein [Streptomyces mutabilis]GGQ26075.1 hypothetical protein GCM10010279_37440 [Streptomyces mutabilis]